MQIDETLSSMFLVPENTIWINNVLYCAENYVNIGKKQATKEIYFLRS